MFADKQSHFLSLMSELHDAVSGNRLDDVVALVSEGSVITKDVLETAESEDISHFLEQCISAAREIFQSLSVNVREYLNCGVPPCFMFRQALMVSNGPVVLAVQDIIEEHLRESIIAAIPDGPTIYNNIVNPVSEDLVDLHTFSENLKEAVYNEHVELCQSFPHLSPHDSFSLRHNNCISKIIAEAIKRRKIRHLLVLQEKGLLFPFPAEILQHDLSETSIDTLSFLFRSGFPGQPVLFDAVRTSIDVLVEERLQNAILAWKSGVADVDLTDSIGNTPLMIAAWEGLSVVCQCLLDCGANVNSVNCNGYSSLHMAAYAGHLNLCKLLIYSGANMTIATRFGHCPLHTAALSGALQVCLFLISCGADVNSQSLQQATPLSLAAMEGHVDICKALITAGAEIDATDNFGFQPIHEAAKSGRSSVCQYLLDAGADVNSVTADSFTPLYLATRNGELDTCKVLVRAGANLTIGNKTGYQPLHIAALSGAFQMCQYLLSCGTDVNCVNSENVTSLCLAAEKGCLDVCKALVEASADIHPSKRGGFQPLHRAARSGALDVCEYLLRCGANVHSRTLSGHTPLLLAAEEGHLQVCKVLVRAGAKVNIYPKSVDQPLHLAAKSGALQVCKYLISAGANINPKSFFNQTPLALAALKGQLEVFKTLVEAGADTTIANRNGHQPLHIAALSGASRICHYLFYYGVDVNCMTPEKKTPLMLAAARGHSSLCRQLIMRGANAKAIDVFGKSALDYAIQNHHLEVILLLLSMHAVPSDFLSSVLKTHSQKFSFESFVESLHLIKRSTDIDFESLLWSKENAAFYFRQALIVSNSSAVLQFDQLIDSKTRDKIILSIPDGPSIYERIVGLDTHRPHVCVQTVLGALEKTSDSDVIESLQSLPRFSSDLVCNCQHHHFVNVLVSKAIDRRSVSILSLLKEKGFLFPFPPEILESEISDRAITIIQFLLFSGFPGEPVLLSKDSNDIEGLLESRLQNALVAWKYGIADVNFQDTLGWTPFLFSCDLKLVDVCEALIEYGADVSLTNNQGEAPLHVASRVDSMELCELILKQGCEKDAITTKGITPLFLALENNHRELFRYLIRQNAGPLVNIEAPAENTLFLAVKRGNLEICELLFRRIERGLVRKTLPLSQEALFDLFRTSVTEGHVEICQLLHKYLLQDINYQDEKRRPLLFSATTAKMAAFLLSIDADPNIRDRNGFASYHAFAQRGNFEIMQYFLDRGFVVNPASNTGITPLHDAAMFGHVQIVELLVQNGASANTCSFDGLSVLQLAISAGSFNVVHYLIRVGADLPQVIDDSDPKNETTVLLVNCKQAQDVLQKGPDFDYQYYLDLGVPAEFLYRQALLFELVPIAVRLNKSIPDWLRRRFCFDVPEGIDLFNRMFVEGTDATARRHIDRDIIHFCDEIDLNFLAHGNFSVVYWAQFTTGSTSHPVTIKVPRLPEFEVDIVREYNCLKHLREAESEYRDFIIDPIGLARLPCDGREVLSLVMEKCDESLYSYLKCSGLDQRQLLRVCLQAAKAVCLAHQECIYHGELTLGNFFISCDGTVKLGDLGACRAGETRSVWTTDRLGTRLLVAPLVYDGSVNPITATDVYNLGVCFLDVFNHEITLNMTVAEILRATSIPCTLVPFDTFRSLIERMVDHDPKMRPSMHEVVAEIESEIRRIMRCQ